MGAARRARRVCQKKTPLIKLTLVLTLVALCFGDHGFVAKAVELLLDQVEPFRDTCTATGHHWTVVVDSRHGVNLV